MLQGEQGCVPFKPKVPTGHAYAVAASTHSMPLPTKPGAQVQIRLPAVLVHSPPVTAHPPFCRLHSFTSAQRTPLPENPALQLHENDPIMLEHVASSLHVDPPTLHSSMSVQNRPLPEKPALHRQLKDPAVSVQVADASHPPFKTAHSLI